MILEGVVTTLDGEGRVNVSPMGPRVPPEMDRFTLKPYQTSQTYQNLKRHKEGVFHVTDDVELIARAAVGPVDPPLARARHVEGFYLKDACRVYEFRVRDLDDREERTIIEVDVVYRKRLRDFFGFHRARHAVLEAAILATRTAFIPIDDILRQFQNLSVLVEKTGGEVERRSFEFLRQYVVSQGELQRTGSEVR